MYYSAPQYTRVDAGSRTSYKEARLIHRHIYVRYDHHTWNSFTYDFNTHKGDTSFILRETYDRSKIQMHCTSEGGTHYCPNYGKFLQVYQLCTTLYSQKYVHTHMSLLNVPFQNYFPFAVIISSTLLGRLSTRFWSMAVCSFSYRCGL